MKRLTRRAESEGVKAVYYGKKYVFLEGEPGYAEADKLAHYEDLEETGRLVVLPDEKAKDLLIKVISESDIICPSDLGLPSQLHCNHHTCKKCWEAALKGESDEQI